MTTINRLIPPRAKAAVRRLLLGFGVRALLRLKDGELPTPAMLQALTRGWGNPGFAANIDYLEEVARYAIATQGPILECGSGLTTLLLGMLAGRRAVQVRSLEDSAPWQQRICTVLERHQVPNVAVLHSPLHDYGDFTWYDPPLQECPDSFRLVVCDGPRGRTKGGRYGLLPVYGARLPAGAVILLDDADRPGEVELLNRWRQEAAFAVKVFHKPAGCFATLVKGS